MADAPTCVIIGGGGHARVLIDALQTTRSPHRLAVLDVDPRRWNLTMLDVPIVGDERCLGDLVAAGLTHFAIGVGGAANTMPRQRLYENALTFGLEPLSIVHPAATVSRWATIGPGAQLLAGAIVNAGARIGANAIINSGAIVEHDCTIGDHVHVATGARLASTVQVGDGAHIGAGAVIRQLIRIGPAAVVGAGAVVVNDVSASTTVVGVPAKPLSPRSSVRQK